MAITAMIRTSSPIVRPKIEPILDGVQLQKLVRENNFPKWVPELRYYIAIQNLSFKIRP